MFVTPQSFEGIRRTDYVSTRIQDAGLGDQVYRYPRNALTATANTAQEIGAEIANIIEESKKAILLTEIRLTSGMHAIAISFEQKEDGNVKATYLDPTGNRTPRDLMPFITQLINGAGLQGKTTFETGIPAQQHKGQPNTCMLWLTRNTCDFFRTGQIVAPQSAEQADELITDELENYLKFESTTQVDPHAGFTDYMQFAKS